MYLFAGSFENPDVSLTERLAALTDHYRELVTVNKAMVSRVRTALKTGDVHKNAMIVLSSFSQVFSMDELQRNRVVARFFDQS